MGLNNGNPVRLRNGGQRLLLLTTVGVFSKRQDDQQQVLASQKGVLLEGSRFPW